MNFKQYIYVLLIITFCSIKADVVSDIENTLLQKAKTDFNNALNGINIQDEINNGISSALNELRQKYANNNQAVVKTGFPDENALVKNRLAKTKIALSKFLGKDSDLKIAFAGSGGGYRAMVYALGVLQGAQETGLLDATTYMSALSGSTWALNAWLASGQDLGALTQQIKTNLAQNYEVPGFNLGSPIPDKLNQFKQPDVMLENFFKKYLFNQPFTSIDIWGAAIAGNLLGVQGDLLTQQGNKVESGQWVYPINTAINPQGGANYDWYEFTPFEVRNLNTQQFVPTWAFGKTFQGGKSTDSAPEQVLSFYLGTFGSAFAVSPEELIRIQNVAEEVSEALSQKIIDEIFDKTDALKNHLVAFVQSVNLPRATTSIPAKTVTTPAVPAVIKWGITLVPAVPAKTVTITPEIPGVKIPDDIIQGAINTFVNTKIENAKEPLRQKIKAEIKSQLNVALDKLPKTVAGARLFPARLPGFDGTDVTLVDAGIDANIPLMPLVKRNVDVIIVIDGSETVQGAPELKKALMELQKNNQINLNDYKDLDFTKYGYGSLSIIKGSGKVPTIIYIPMAKDAALQDVDEQKSFTKAELDNLKAFDPQNCTQNGDCNTFNFKYNPNSFDNLFNLGKFNLISNIEKIKEVIKEA